MKTNLSVLSFEEINLVSGGHFGFGSALAVTIGILELPHIFMGLKEFTNYVVELTQGNIEPNDYFTQFFVGLFQGTPSTLVLESTSSELQ